MITLWIPFLCFILIYAIYVYDKLQYWKKRMVPHKSPHPTFGNVLDFVKYTNALDHNDDKVNYYNAFYKERYYGMYFFHQPILVLKDPELIRSVLISDFKYFTDRQDFGNDYDVLMQNLITFRGGKWKSLRQKLLPMFTPNKIKRMFHLILEQAESIVKYIEKNESESNNTEILNIMQIYTLNLIGSIGFGLSFTAETDQNTEYHKTGYKLFNSNIKNITRFGIRLNLKILSNIFRLRVFSKRTEDFFLNMTKNIIDSRNGVPSKRNDFIDLLLELKEKHDINDDIEIDYKFIAAQLFTFFSAGFQTTSATLTNILMELAHNTEIQNKLYDMLKETPENITYETIANMPYMEAVINESLRKYPGVILFPRTCSQTFKLPDTDLIIEKGKQIIIPVMEIHHDPKYYPEPEKFNPERFVNNMKIQSNLFLSFGIGPRACLAVKFAQLQIKLGLILILKNFKISLCDKSVYPIPYHAPMLVPKPKNGVWLKFIKRNGT